MVCERGLREDNLEGGGVALLLEALVLADQERELGRFGVVYVDAADSIGSFPLRCQLGGTFGRGGESKD